MARREFIETREIVYVNAPIAPILQGDSIHYEDIAFKAQIGRIHSFSEQDIVKPYLERLKRRMEARDDDNGGEPLNAVDRGYHWAYEHLCEEIDNLLSESDWNAPFSKRHEKLIDANDIRMTRTEAVNELNFFKETIPKEPPEECDYLDEWYDSHKKFINAINMGIEALLEKQKTIIETEKTESGKK